ncbi:MAG: hypothetical protein RI985_331 [Chloroflexota bacterium]|jgi:tetratricopeptide (TPR) repeat protein
MATSLPFFGRDMELQLLHDAWHTTNATHSPQIVTFVAETGVGKSRIIQEFYRQLSVDNKWDPNDFWPDDFQSNATQLRVNPQFTSSSMPKGAPRYLWLGVRWQNIDERNVANSLALPTIKEQLIAITLHIKEMRSRWQNIVDAGIAELEELITIRGALNATLKFVPYGDFISDVIEYGERVGREVLGATPTAPTLPDQLIDLFQTWFRLFDTTPIVLWLDDVHWIDDEAKTFFTKLIADARQERWPILIVATSWPAEWNEFDETFFLKQKNATIHHLDNATDCELQKILNAEYPHLPPNQRQLLIDKANGNFLTMIENIAELRSKPRYFFVNSDKNNPLSPNGITLIATWESNRQRRITQRFHNLDEDIQDFLARASYAGLHTQFLQRVLFRYRAVYPDQYAVEELLQRSQESLSIIWPITSSIHEFRDRGYFAVAQQHFIALLKEFELEPLRSTLLDELTESVQSAFDHLGNLCNPQLNPTSLRAAPSREQFFILDLALCSFPPNTPAHVQAFVALIARSVADNSWSKINTILRSNSPDTNTNHYDAIDWAYHAGRTISWDAIRLVANTQLRIGNLEKAEHLYQRIIEYRRLQLQTTPSPDYQRELSIDLTNIGRIFATQGNYHSAIMLLTEALANFKQLHVTQRAIPDVRHLCTVLNNIGKSYQSTGDSINALPYFNEALAYCSQLINMGGHNEDLESLALTLTNIADIRREQGEIELALTCYNQSHVTYHKLNTQRHSIEDRRNLAISLNNLGIAYQMNANHTQALMYFKESLSICKEVVQIRGAPDDLHELSTTLNLIGRQHELQRNFNDASLMYGESLQNSRTLNTLRTTPNDLRDLSIALSHVGRIYHAQGDFAQAITYYEESIGVSQQLITHRVSMNDELNHASILNALGQLHQSRGEFDIAMGYFLQVLTIKRNLAQSKSTPTHVRELIITLHFLGRMWLNKEQPLTALPLFEEAVPLATMLTANHNTKDGAKLLAATYDLMSRTHESLHNILSALDYANKALMICMHFKHTIDFTQDDVSYLEKRVYNLQHHT